MNLFLISFNKIHKYRNQELGVELSKNMYALSIQVFTSNNNFVISRIINIFTKIKCILTVTPKNKKKFKNSKQLSSVSTDGFLKFFILMLRRFRGIKSDGNFEGQNEKWRR